MITLNRGEWSELYCVLFLLIKPNLKIVDENLHDISETIFEVKRIIAEMNFPLEYDVLDERIVVYVAKEKIKEYSREEISRKKDELYSKISAVTTKKGSFSIESVEEFLQDFSLGQVIKAKSGLKEDIEAIVFDNISGTQNNLKYSIKSALGSPATLLNSSGQTNFKYRVAGMTDSLMSKINNIKTRTKLKDRLKVIYDNKCRIEFDSVESKVFASNLKMVDSLMDKYIANTLLYSYSSDNKILKNIFIEANGFTDEIIAIKKLGDFLDAISFGFFPGHLWDGKTSVNGGILLVKENGQVVVLDLIYHRNSVRNYLINNTQLDSPSSTRYHMLEIFKEDDKYYFTLNLQIRYIKS